MSQETCPSCGKGILVKTIVSEGKIQKIFSCGHKKVEVSVFDTINVSDNVNLAKRFSSSFNNLSGSVSIASGLVKNLPREKLDELGINDTALNYLRNIEQNTKFLVENLPRSRPPNFIIWAPNATAPIQVSQQGDNIIITTDIENTFNNIHQEIDLSTRIDRSTKTQIKSKINELKMEIGKQQPDKSKIIKIWDEVKALAPFLVSLAQLTQIISKILLGS